MWKDFFYYSKTERRGVITLFVLILGVGIASRIHLANSSQEEVDPAVQAKFEQEYTDFMASIREVEQSKEGSQSHWKPYPKREIVLSPFDPNTADSVTFLQLGLPSWMAKNILRYRSKQGRFRNPEDFKKIYGLTDEQYQTLRPYIRISPEDVAQKDTFQLLITQKEKRDTVFKYQPGTIIDLNNADTTELKKIPGIGSGIARMIVNYRRRLGGFYKIEQLKEIDLKVEKLRPWFSIDGSRTQRINVNRASLERMMYHPYINFYQAKIIVEYRRNKGKLESLKQLSLYEEFTPDDMERLHPYICYD